MERTARVRLRESERNTLEDVADSAQGRHTPVAPGVELLAVDQIHHDVEVALVEVGPALEPVHSNDVRMIELKQDAALAPHARLVPLALLSAEIGSSK